MYATLPVYYPSYQYANAHNEAELWRESHRVSRECRGQINRRAMEAHNSRELDLMIDDLIRIYGIERTMCVLSRTVQFKDWDERISQAVKDRAKRFDFKASEYEKEDATKKYILDRIDPCVIDLMYRRLMGKEAEALSLDSQQEQAACEREI